jgi:hypothetical protein
LPWQWLGVAKAEGSFSPDRPGFGTGTHTAAPASFYLELGYEYSFLPDNTNAMHRLPYTNVRYGLNPRLEVNLMWGGLVGHDGFTLEKSLVIGAKHRLFNGENANVTFLGMLGISKPTVIELAPTGGLLWDYEVFSGLELMGVMLMGYEEDLFTQFSLGVAVALSERVGVYGEYYNEYLPDKASLNNYIDTGLTFLLTNKVQLDTYFTTQLAANSYTHIGIGYARKF